MVHLQYLYNTYIQYNGILHSRKKEGAPTLRDSIDRTGEHYAK